MDVLVPYFLTGMAVVALGCTSEIDHHAGWDHLRKVYRSHPQAIVLAVALAVALLSFFWPFVLWSILIRRKPS